MFSKTSTGIAPRARRRPFANKQVEAEAFGAEF
jgi:hypothetical protein